MAFSLIFSSSENTESKEIITQENTCTFLSPKLKKPKYSTLYTAKLTVPHFPMKLLKPLKLCPIPEGFRFSPLQKGNQYARIMNKLQRNSNNDLFFKNFIKTLKIEECNQYKMENMNV